MPYTWWMGIRSFMIVINGYLKFERTIVPLTNVKDDIALMDAVLKFNHSTRDLQNINQVRLYLNVYYLSDIIHLPTTECRSTTIPCPDTTDVFHITIIVASTQHTNTNRVEFLETGNATRFHTPTLSHPTVLTVSKLECN